MTQHMSPDMPATSFDVHDSLALPRLQFSAHELSFQRTLELLQPCPPLLLWLLAGL